MTDRYSNDLKLALNTHTTHNENIVAALQEISPDLAKYALECPLGETTCKPSVDRKTREIATISALISLGKIEQLKLHISNALDLGWSEKEIKEIILQLAVYTGFPTALNAMYAAKEVFEEKNKASIKN